jgi:GT2 family glycosyltransferase/tetratricopeptide (TPR) repeat protein/2-polyprenyl-3-methyl-5-hydroxy-6-metoxy-1,4-benzoquinol methylase
MWLWANEPDNPLRATIAVQKLNRTVICSDNAHVHARFALALTAPTEYVAIFDDDALPGPNWFASCLRVMDRTPGILGSAGVRLQGNGYQQRTLHGWHTPIAETVEVDLVGHAWFLRTEWIHYLFAVPAVVGINGEDIELAARVWRLAGVRCWSPPHPLEDRSVWGSVRGVELGSDAVALSRRPTHLQERDQVVRTEIAAGWKPLFIRGHPNTLEVSRSPQPARNLSLPATPSLPPLKRGRDGEAPLALLDLVPLSARRILEIGCADGRFGRAIKARQTARVVGVEQNRHVVAAARGQLDEVLEGSVEEVSGRLSKESFDCVLCRRPELLRDPEWFLRQARNWLTADGKLIARFPNVRHHSLVGSLLDGTWGFEPNGPVGRDHIRFYTRREIEKLFYRAGFALEALQAVPGSGYQAWVEQGRPGEVRAGAFHTAGLSADEAEEFYASHYHVRAVPAPIHDHGLTSIILITFNQIEYTRLCVESIRLRTDELYELVFVDNASTDGTADYLRSLPSARVIFNKGNRGFPAAVNQGMQLATGKQVLLLNNDTVVTTGWLGRMLRALYSDPRIGLVGPCSNRVSGEQEVPVSYEDLSDLDGFAWIWGKARQGLLEETDRLVGFCLLIRRELIDKIGMLDERFGTGCFEDDDYCLRCRKAGYRAVIAREAFVHHFGGRTFAGSGVDFAALMRRNQQLFNEKWHSGGDQPAPLGPSSSAVKDSATEPPSYQLEAVPGGKGLRLVRADLLLSMCMIARNNTKTLRAALESIRPHVDDMVVVDTGSTDDTPEIARSLGARVFQFPWCDSFAAARNESLRHAWGRWIFWMDSDDTIDEKNGRQLRELARRTPANSPIMGYVVSVHCPSTNPADPEGFTRVTHIKLIRNLPQLQFDHRIHEQILPSIEKSGGKVEQTNLFVVHSGYDTSPEGQKRKIERDLRLLHLELSERPDHPFTLFNLGMTYADIGRPSEAINYLERCLAHSNETSSHVRKTHALLSFCHASLGNEKRAWQACERGLGTFPLDAELRFRKGALLHSQGRLDEAARTYQDLLDNPESAHYTSVNVGVNGHLTRHNLALVYLDQGDGARAEEELRRVTREHPQFRPAWRALGELLIRVNRLEEAISLAYQLAGEPRMRPVSRLLKADVALTRGQKAEARQEMERASTECPEDCEVLGALCRFLFEHASVTEAEGALTALVRCAPNDAAARHNLGTVYLETGRPALAAEEYRESLRLRPISPVTTSQLGLALEAQGRFQEAVAAWQEALHLDPNNSMAREGIQRAQAASGAPVPGRSARR